MPTPNASSGRDPAVSTNNNDRAHSPDASFEEAAVDIPMMPPTLAAMKQRDPYSSIGSASDDAGILDEAVREGHEGY